MDSVVKLVAAERQTVDELIRQQLNANEPLLNEISGYIISNGGKRLRPTVLLLSAKACHGNLDTACLLAAILEIFHTATLLHDDVVDDSKLRRGNETANQRWGNEASILTGDYLYAQVFSMLVEIDSRHIMRLLSSGTKTLIEAEIKQLSHVGDVDLDEETYYDIIYGKTAKLFEIAAQLGAEVSDSATVYADALSEYGKNLGLAFQLVDDMLDYTGNADLLGKNIGDDLAEGKLTLPLLYALRQSNADLTELKSVVASGEGATQIEQIQALIRDTDAINYTYEQARKCSEKAIDALQCLPASQERDALEVIALSALDRNC